MHNFGPPPVMPRSSPSDDPRRPRQGRRGAADAAAGRGHRKLHFDGAAWPRQRRRLPQRRRSTRFASAAWVAARVRLRWRARGCGRGLPDRMRVRPAQPRSHVALVVPSAARTMGPLLPERRPLVVPSTIRRMGP